jgi:hypothetical protein
MRKNRGILKDLKAATCHDMMTVLKNVDQDLLKAAVAGERFQEYFFANSTDEALRDYIWAGPAAEARPGTLPRSPARRRLPTTSDG